jgi:hypothetical protein
LAAFFAVSTFALATWLVLLSFSLDTNAFPFVKSMTFVIAFALAIWRVLLSFSLDTNAFPFVKSMTLVIAADGYGVTGVTGLALLEVDGKVEGNMGNV